MSPIKQLYDQFVPINYNLSVVINRYERTTSGVVTLTGKSLSDDFTISLHSKDLTIKTVTVDGKNAEFRHSNNDTLIISHPSIVPAEHIIVVSFAGKISDAMHGIYPCYFEHNGLKKELVATQFESHHAREVFPCIDEPAAKATFDVTLTTEKDITVLGNMPIKSQITDINDRLVTTFNTTPVMSSYLLAWVLGEMHKQTATTKSGVEVNVWATLAQPKDNLDFALDIAVKSIEFFEDYFGIPYPLPKSDQVALPDFSSGAMENWGLVTYREIALLVDPKTTSVFNKRYVALVIAHELSHQWFGNLVTMKWWNDLWLNESFATMMEYVAIDSIKPDWNIWMDFDNHEGVSALQRDSLDGVQSVQTEVNHPDEINTLFDGAIVYAKGARLLRMLREYIGDEHFKQGLTNYFKKYAYKNTKGNDLWRELDTISQKNITNLMNIWISQPGFPVVHVSKNNNFITLSQNKLISNNNLLANVIWPIPLVSNYQELPEIFDVQETSIPKKSNKPLQLNLGNKSHFITHYSHDLLVQLITEIKNGKLSSIDRLQLLNEQTILARAGIITSAELVPLIEAFRDETDESVWSIISLAIGELKCFVENDIDAEKALKSFASSLAKNHFQRLGWSCKEPNESETDTKLRLYIVSLMIYGETSYVLDEAVSIYNSAPFEDLTPEIRSLELSVAIRDCENESTIIELLKTYSSTNSAGLKQDITSGLTSVRKPIAISLLLNSIKDSSVIRTQDAFRWVLYLLLNKYSRKQTWQWVRDNWDWITEKYGGDKSYDDFPRFVAMALSTRAQLKEYCDFFDEYRSVPALTRNIEMGIVEIENRVARIERDKDSVHQALNNF